MNLEKRFAELMKNGRTFVKGIRGYRELEAYAAERGYQLKEAPFGTGLIPVRLEVVA